MDAKLKSLWIKALRSRKYKQGESYLALDGRFCCLGVLCDVALKNDLVPDGVIIEAADGHIYCNDQDKVVPAAPFGLTREVVQGAWQRNDGEEGFSKHTFRKIADWLETAVPTDEPKA